MRYLTDYIIIVTGRVILQLIGGSSVERLMNFLNALDRDVDIVIRRRPGTHRGGRILVTAV
jgi:hypothetical protein